MTVRPFRSSDLAALIALKRDTIRRVNARDYSPEQVDAWAPDDSAIATWPARMAGRFVVVAVDDRDVPIGFGDIGPDGHIDQFFISADHQRRGVGRAILLTLIAEADRRGLLHIFSDVSLTARPFFESHGFVVDAEQTVVARGVAFTNFRMSRTP